MKFFNLINISDFRILELKLIGGDAAIGRLALTYSALWDQGSATIDKSDLKGLGIVLGMDLAAIETFIDKLREARLVSVDEAGNVILVDLHEELMRLNVKRQYDAQKKREERCRTGKVKQTPKGKVETQPESKLTVADLLALIADGKETEANLHGDEELPFDDGYHVKMTLREYLSLVKRLPPEAVSYQISALEKYAKEKPGKFRQYKSHASTIANWHRMKLEKGLTFFEHPDSGVGYYPQWLKERVSA